MNNKTIANELNQNIDCNWRPDFKRDESWKETGSAKAESLIKEARAAKGSLVAFDVNTMIVADKGEAK